MPIPKEVRDCAQWLVSGPDKAPRSVHTGKLADVRDRTQYATFAEALAYADSKGLDFGFALTPDDPFTVIDLDAPENPEQENRHSKILAAFDTYVEYSRSGKGLHIWMRGRVPRGVRRDKVEVYSSERYIICTGNEFRDRPLTDQQELLDVLFEEMGRGVSLLSELDELTPLQSDADVVTMASNAVNGDKFDQLCRGDWEHEYPSQSEADYALMNMLCFYSRSNQQVKRLFRYSKLGKRDKAQRDKYLDRMIAKIRAEAPEHIDFSGLQVRSHTEHATQKNSGSPVPVQERTNSEPPSHKADFSYPPGLVGEVARYIHDSSIRPVPHVATAASLGLFAGILGRQYNISGSGLNLYLILLGKTGIGKEGGASGIDRMLAATAETIPVVREFIGPGTFASGQAVIRTLDEKPSFVSILGEFGLTLQQLSDPRSGNHLLVLRRVLLDLYSKSGENKTLHSSAYSDKEKNTKTLISPALTILAESTPETFYAGLTPTHVDDGLIPRFVFLEYTGNRPPRNRNAFFDPPENLIRTFGERVETALRMSANRSWMHVEIDPSARSLLNAFDKKADREINTGNPTHAQIWNRAHLNALRIAGLLAVADNPHNPVVLTEQAQWAIDSVHRSCDALTTRFEEGDIGDGVSKQMVDVKRKIVDLLDEQPWPGTNVIHRSDIAKRVYNLSSFKHHRIRPLHAFNDVLNELEKAGVIQAVPKKQAREQFNSRAELLHVDPDLV